ncbi:hypothetical protein C8R47DRAFT_989916 [Mycena vitilis]|nr:hypothetical protein C8R47DRAFT_989916 [Mycena vitilis]
MPLTPLSASVTDRLLRTNDPPADAEIPFFVDFARNGRHGLDSLTAQIDILRASLDQLVSERDDLAERVQQHTSVLAPVRRVPPELICEILSWTTLCTRRAVESPPSGAPWYLGQVCGRWRGLALGLPSLWSSIAFFHTLDHPHERTSPLRLVQAQLVRSANVPLHVDFEWNHPDWDHMDVAAHFGTLSSPNPTAGHPFV